MDRRLHLALALLVPVAAGALTQEELIGKWALETTEVVFVEQVEALAGIVPVALEVNTTPEPNSYDFVAIEFVDVDLAVLHRRDGSVQRGLWSLFAYPVLGLTSLYRHFVTIEYRVAGDESAEGRKTVRLSVAMSIYGAAGGSACYLQGEAFNLQIYAICRMLREE